MSKGASWETIENNLIGEVLAHQSSGEDIDINGIDECGVSLMHISCRLEMSKLCKVLLQNNADINILDKNGRTPLMTASYFGHLCIVELLLEYGALWSQVDMYGFSPMMYAVYSGNFELFKLLFHKEELSVEKYQNTFLGCMTPLALASAVGNYDVVKYIISLDPEFINCPVTKSGLTPLMLTICGRHGDMAENLIKNKANLHSKSSYELSSIGYAKICSVPLLKLEIPLLNIPDDENWNYSSSNKRRHPLTPNVYISPIKKLASPKKYMEWIKISMKQKRARSLDKKTNEKHEDSDDNVLKSILEMAKLEEYWNLFKEQEIHFKAFLTMDNEDLSAIGITKSSVRLKLLNLIDHYKKIFYSK